MVRCGRPGGGGPGGEHCDQRGQLGIGRPAADHPEHRSARLALAHSGMFPCFFGGSVSRLVRSIRSAWTTYRRVYDGGITESM